MRCRDTIKLSNDFDTYMRSPLSVLLGMVKTVMVYHRLIVGCYALQRAVQVRDIDAIQHRLSLVRAFCLFQYFVVRERETNYLIVRSIVQLCNHAIVYEKR
jgi:hypothetical protein